MVARRKKYRKWVVNHHYGPTGHWISYIDPDTFVKITVEPS